VSTLSLFEDREQGKFSIYRSSAGSGKTSTLVKEYLKLALAEESAFRQILAITFTNKAAAEMKSRILAAVKDFADKKLPQLDTRHTSLAGSLIDDLRMPYSELQKKSSALLKKLLHEYDQLAIGTIDSFVYRIVRTFARDLNLPAQFEVEVDEKIALREAVDVLMSQIGIDEALTDHLVSFALYKKDEGKKWRIEQDLLTASEVLLTEGAGFQLKKIQHLGTHDFNRIREKILRVNVRIIEMIQAHAGAAVKIMEENGLSEDSFYQKARGIGGFFYKFNRSFNSDTFEAVDHANVRSAILDNLWYPKNALPNVKRAIEEIAPELREKYKAIQTIIFKEGSAFTLNELILENLFAVAVLNDLHRILVRIKQSRQFLNIGDFNQLIAPIVDEEPLPFIYERVGERYVHFLIDEFQDTSVLQWRNLLPLVDNALAIGRLNLVVGDGKQAIYRFRGGDVEQFARLPYLYPPDDSPIAKEREASLVRHRTEYVLERNYRSLPEIVAFNNDLFDFCAKMEELKFPAIYAHHRQIALESEKRGLLSLDFLDDNDSYDENMLHHILERIRWAEEDGFAWKDIAVLCRQNQEAVRVARYLSEHKINVVSTESLLVQRSDAGRFFTAIFKFFNRPYDKVAGAESLYFFFEYVLGGAWSSDIQSDFEYGVQSPDRLIEIIRKHGFDADMQELQRDPIFEFAEAIVTTFRLSERQDPYVQFFLEAVLEFSSKKGNSFENFLNWWELKSDEYSAVIPEGAPAVSVLTIHKAKGLEFPVVIVPFADWDTYTKTVDYLWIEGPGTLTTTMIKIKSSLSRTQYVDRHDEEIFKTFLDSLNLLYVALTRAKMRLHVIGKFHTPQNLERRNRISKIIAQYLAAKKQWDGMKKRFEFGKRERFELKTDRTNSLDGRMISADWRRKLKIKYSPSIEVRERIDWGNLVHRIMARLNGPDDWPKVINESARQENLSVDMVSELNTLMKEWQYHEELRSFFDPVWQIKTEASILMPNGTTLRADRVIWHDGHARVIDYKTGKPTEDDRAQMRLYKNALLDMGFEKVDGYLVYFQTGKIVSA